MTRITMEKGAVKVTQRLLDAGYAAYVVGGCVRDALLGKAPNDWDICSSALPQETLALFGEKNCIPTGLKHGTVTVKMDGGFYEVTTFRTDGEYTDGRHPDSVDFVADVCADLARRDFTINAMAYNDREGLVDPFGGREDLLSRRIVRAVGDAHKRFSEDALRVMRLFRFATRYGLAIEERTREGAIALRENLRRVSGERTREELFKLLDTAKPGGYLPYEIACIIVPEMEEISAVRYAQTLDCVDALRPDAELRLAALLSPLCKRDDLRAAYAVLGRLRCSNKTAERVNCMLAGALDVYEEDRAAMRVRARRELGRIGMDAIEDILILAGAIRESADAQKIGEFAAMAREAKELGLCCSMKELAVNGGDVMRVLGGGAGPKVGAILSALLDAVLEDRLANERDALLIAAKDMVSEGKEKQ